MPDFQNACNPVIVDTMVFVECEINLSQRIDKTNWVASLASENSIIQRIVVFCGLEKGQQIRSTTRKIICHSKG
ncbi:MAG: hypothetical protein MK289_18475 [Trichodesmium sp. ALOHA_ZT_67]|uniref:hypothetical protein n=1 Tax=Trichodesmium erythraeum TaxID=1206 RepID=UPI001BD32C56|nr:hypothetical protein [Trichodesmium erythraeum GBRTRLIN201]MCH2050390.1 hypothetical protein [Trichodesmium sp. ALOHA_ZT_67]MDE5093244.1 hypothetical protein [Trichodesmium sp. St11_bin5]MDT9338652.1 hypothetical protein [Trichodesmium erythraeum 21-75]